MQIKLAVLSGDGIGPQVVSEATKVLNLVAERRSIDLSVQYAKVGGVALEHFDTPLPSETLDVCRASDAVLLGAIGDPKWDDAPSDKRPEKGLLGLREGLGLYANLRPAKIYPGLVNASTLKSDVIEDIDILIVRELTGGIYFGKPAALETDRGYNTMVYERHEVERIAHMAFKAAQKRNKRVTSVDKANVLQVSQFWRKVVNEVAQDYPDVQLSHMYVDNAAMQLIRWPKQFDVILTGNMFGDILSDQASMLTGSLGMLPSASLGAKTALYEPVHGSAPDIAGQNKANPIATIASIAMMLIYSFSLLDEANAIEKAIAAVLAQGLRTADIADKNTSPISTQQMGDAICEEIQQFLS